MKKFKLKEREEEARERLRAFWAGSSLGRPVLLAGVPSKPFSPREKNKWDSMDRKQQEWDPDCQREGTDWWLSHTTQLWMAESMPRVCMAPGACLALPAVLAGADYSFDDNTAWVHPIPDLYSRTPPEFDPRNKLMKSLVSCVQAQIDAVKGRAFVNPPLFLDALTTLSMLRTPEMLCLDVLETPENVHRWRDAITELTICTYEQIYQMLLANGHGEAGSFFTLMAEGRMEAVQCDFAVMLSPEQFAEFAIPDLRRMTEYLDFSLYHLDGTCQLRFLDLLRTLPKLNGIQWNPEPSAGSPIKWIEAFREIRRRNFCLAVSCANMEEAGILTRELGPDGLALFLPEFPTPEKVEEAIELIEHACRGR